MKLVILDRDGTICEAGAEYADSPDTWQPYPGALEAIARLNHAGWHVVIASNHGGLGRGQYEMSMVNAIQLRMHKMLAAVGGRVDSLFFCPHAPDERCHCRKPEPGLFEQIGERYGIEWSEIPAVGDALEDLVAGAAAGCEPHLVLTGQGAQYRDRALPDTFPPGTMVHEDLAAFAQYLTTRDETAAVAPAQ